MRDVLLTSDVGVGDRLDVHGSCACSASHSEYVGKVVYEKLAPRREQSEQELPAGLVYTPMGPSGVAPQHLEEFRYFLAQYRWAKANVDVEASEQ